MNYTSSIRCPECGSLDDSWQDIEHFKFYGVDIMGRLERCSNCGHRVVQIIVDGELVKLLKPVTTR